MPTNITIADQWCRAAKKVEKHGSRDTQEFQLLRNAGREPLSRFYTNFTHSSICLVVTDQLTDQCISIIIQFAFRELIKRKDICIDIVFKIQDDEITCCVIGEKRGNKQKKGGNKAKYSVELGYNEIMAILH